MTPARAYLLRELRLVRLPFLLALVAHLAGTGLFNQRSYATLLDPDEPFVPMLFAAWLGYHRVYSEQARGTWLLQPFSRSRVIALKGAVAASALIALALVHALVVYAWVASASTPGGPVRSLGAYLVEAMSRDVGAALAIFASMCAASFAESRIRRVVWIAAGLLWSALVCLDAGYQRARLGLGDAWGEATWGPAWALVVAVVGAMLVLGLGERFGRAPSVRGDVLSAIWLTPLFFVASSFASSFVARSAPSHWQSTVVLHDGEVVVADFERGGDSRSRREVELVSAGALQLQPSFGSSWWTGTYNAFASEDARTLLLYDQSSGRLAGCWGANGVRSSTPCAPFDRITSVSQRHVDRSLAGLSLVTNDALIDLDVDGTVHERFRGDGLEGVAILDSGNVRAILTPDATTLIGRIDRRCPATSPDARLGLLDDDTLVAVHEGTITYCRPSVEVSTAPWPRIDGTEERFALETALLFPLLRPAPDASLPTWWVAVALRVLGWIALGLAFRRRGWLVSAPGVVLGPAYFVAAALVLLDGSRLASWWARIRARGAPPRLAHGG